MDSRLTLTHTGSSVSGQGYGFDIYRNDDRSRYFAQLRIGPNLYSSLADGWRRMMVPVENYDAAETLGQAFCHACRQWQVVQNRERAMANGYAVIG